MNTPFIDSADPRGVACLLPGWPPLDFYGLEMRVRSVRDILLRSGLPASAIIAVDPLPPLDFLSAVLAILPRWACAPIPPRLTSAERDSYLAELRPLARLSTGERLSPLPGGRIANAALLVPTSGTTGKPRIVCLTLRNLETCIRNTCAAFALTSSDRFLCFMPLHHQQGLLSVLAQWSVGGSSVLAGSFDAALFAAWLGEYQPTWYSGSPAIHQAIADLAAGLPHCLRFIRTIGAPITPALSGLLEARFQVPVIEGYGLTETGLVSSNPLPPGRRKAGSAGLAAGPEIRLSHEGEILVRGPSVFAGYLDGGRPPFDSEGWFHTGDLGTLDQDGYLFFRGRLREVINRGGDKIMPVEVDNAVLSHPAVSEAAAFPVPHPTLGQDVACAVVPCAGSGVTIQELRSHCRSLLSPEKLPRHYVFTDSIPRGATGKPQRHLLSVPEPAPSPLTGIPDEILGLWRETLHLEPRSPQEDFFRVGGDSLRAASFLSAISAEFSVPLESLEPFLDEPTPAFLTGLLQRSTTSPLTPDRLTFYPNGSLPPIFLIGPTADHVFTFRELAAELGPKQPLCVLRSAGEEFERPPGHIEACARRAANSISAIFPGGDILLGGYCYGGIVAQHTACLLEQRSRQVRSIILFDAPCPGPHRLRQRWRLFDRMLPLPRKSGMVPHFPQPIRAPIHQFLAGPVSHHSAFIEDTRLSWRRFTRSGLTLHRLDCPHEQLFQHPTVTAVAAAVRSLIA